MKMRSKLFAALGLAGALSLGGFLALSASAEDQRPQFGLDTEDGPSPRYVAVSDGKGGIAGYVELALLEGPDASTPQEVAASAQAQAPGLVIPVYDTSARVVGYFASQTSDFAGTGVEGDDLIPNSPLADQDLPSGFVSTDVRDDLVEKGFLYVAGSPPSAESVGDARPDDTAPPAPSTPNRQG